MLLGRIVSFFLLLAAVYCSIDASPRTAANFVSIMAPLTQAQVVWRYEMITQRRLDQSLDDKEGWSDLYRDWMRAFMGKEVEGYEGRCWKENPIRRWWVGGGDNQRHPMDIYDWSRDLYNEIKAGIPGLTDGEDATGDVAVERSDVEMAMLNDHFVWEYAEKIEEWKERLGDEEVLIPRDHLTRNSERVRQQEGVWWFELLDPLGKALVKSVNTWKTGATCSPLYAKIVAHLESKGLCRKNDDAWEAFRARLGGSETVFTKDSYVTDRLLRAAGVHLSSVPDNHQVFPPKEEIVAFIKDLVDNSPFTKPIDALTAMQREAFQIASKYLDLVEQYRVFVNPNQDFANFRAFLHEISPCDCPRCQKAPVPSMFCEVHHVDPEAKGGFCFRNGQKKQPNACNAQELLPQWVAGALGDRCMPGHRDEDCQMSSIAAGRLANNHTYSWRQLNHYKCVTAALQKLYPAPDGVGVRCAFSDEIISEEEMHHLDNHHIAALFNIIVQGSEDHPAAKVETISAIIYEANSIDDFKKRIEEIVKTRPLLCTAHRLIHIILADSLLQKLLGIVIPWEVRNGSIVIKEEWLDNVPSVEEEGITSEEIRRRFAEFFRKNCFDPNAENPFHKWCREVDQIKEGTELEIKGPKDNDFRSYVAIGRCSVFRVDYDNEGEVEPALVDLTEAQFRIQGVDESDSQRLELVEVGTEISIEWPDDSKFYPATVGFHCPVFNVQNADGDVETVDLARVEFRIQTEAGSQSIEQESQPSDAQSTSEQGSNAGVRRSPRLAGEQPSAVECSSQPPHASDSSDAQSIDQSESDLTDVELPGSGTSVASDASPLEESALEETSSDSMDVESLDGGDVSFEGSISSLDESSPSPLDAPPAVPAAEASSAVVESIAAAEASSAVVKSVAASSPPTPALDMRHLVESNHVFCTMDKSSTSASLGEVRLVATPAETIEVHSVESDGQSQRIGRLLGSSEHHTIFKTIGWLPLEATATLASIGRFQSSILMEYHPIEGVSRDSALEALARFLNVPPSPPTPECSATHAPASSDPLSRLKSMAAAPASMHQFETKQLIVRFRVEGTDMRVQNVAGQMVRLVPGSLSIDVVKLKGGAVLGHVLGAPSHFWRFVGEIDELPFAIGDAQILRRAEYEDTFSLRVHISSKSAAAFDELERLFGEHCCLEVVKSQTKKRKRGI